MNERSYGELRKFLQLVDNIGQPELFITVAKAIGYLLPQVDRMYFVRHSHDTMSGRLKIVMNDTRSHEVRCIYSWSAYGIRFYTPSLSAENFINSSNVIIAVDNHIKLTYENRCGVEPNSSIQLVDDREKFLKQIAKLNRPDYSEISSLLLCFSIMRFQNFTITDVSKMVPRHLGAFGIILPTSDTLTIYLDDAYCTLYYTKEDQFFPHNLGMIKDASDCLEALNKFFSKE